VCVHSGRGSSTARPRNQAFPKWGRKGPRGGRSVRGADRVGTPRTLPTTAARWSYTLPPDASLVFCRSSPPRWSVRRLSTAAGEMHVSVRPTEPCATHVHPCARPHRPVPLSRHFRMRTPHRGWRRIGHNGHPPARRQWPPPAWVQRAPWPQALPSVGSRGLLAVKTAERARVGRVSRG
jgi:hypothetical protein